MANPAGGGPRQRWRIAFSRSGDAASSSHRDVADEWTAALSLVLPLARSETVRPRPALTFAATLPVGVAADRDLADLLLAATLPAWQVREAIAGAAPPGITIAEIFDVWLGAPAIAADVVAADYRITISGEVSPDVLRDAARSLLAAPRLDRQRVRSDRVTTYDLRPLIESIEVLDGPGTAMRVRTRFHPERGAGRPDEVVAALADVAGCPLGVAEITRERVLLTGDPV